MTLSQVTHCPLTPAFVSGFKKKLFHFAIRTSRIFKPSLEKLLCTSSEKDFTMAPTRLFLEFTLSSAQAEARINGGHSGS